MDESYGEKTFFLRLRHFITSPKTKRALFHAVIGVISGAYSLSPAINYIAPAYFTAAWLTRRNYPAAFFGSVIGALLAGNMGLLFTLLLMGAFVMIWTLWQGARGIRTRDKYLILISALLFTVIAFHFDTPEECFRGLLTAAIALLCTLIFHSALQAGNAFINKHISLSVQEQGSLCLFLGLICHVANGALDVFDLMLSPGSVAAIVIAAVFLSAEYISGLAVGVTVAFCAVLSRGLDTALLSSGIMGIAMLLSSLLTPYGKWAQIPCFTVMVLLGSLLVEAFTPIESIAAGIIALILPKRIFLHANALISTLTPAYSRSTESVQLLNGLETTSKVVCSISADISRLSKTPMFASAPLFSINRQLEAVRDAIENTIRSAYAHNTALPREQLSVEFGSMMSASDDQEVSGDFVKAFNTDRSALIILSDGMGRGEAAHEESKRLVELLINLIDAGFELSDALLCANRLLIEEGEDEMYATADVLLLDRTTGEGFMVKQGAPPSFIVRGTRIITVYGEALPVGIVDEAIPFTHSVTFAPGDRIVMLSDGVTDALSGQLIATITETLSRTDDPDLAAQLIVEAAKDSIPPPYDDMTAVLAYVYGE